jgi:hypothetical protein
MAFSIPTDFAGAFGLLCGLLDERPLDLVRLRACFLSLDAYAAAHPGTAWPLVLVATDGTRRPLATVEDLLLHMSLDLLPRN